MSLLVEGLYVFLGVACGGIAGFPSLALAATGPWLADTVGRRRHTPIRRRRQHAVAVVTILIASHVVWIWFLAGWITGWLGCPHGLAIQIGSTLGACTMGCMGWIFICCALDQMITDPAPHPPKAQPVEQTTDPVAR